DGMATLAAPAAAGDLDNPHVVKVVLDRDGYALYFSRAPIPFPRHPGGAAPPPRALRLSARDAAAAGRAGAVAARAQRVARAAAGARERHPAARAGGGERGAGR